MFSSSSLSDTVLFEEYNAAGVITLNRPKALNAINLEMVKQIYTHMKPWESQKELVIIRGVGDKAFCAGGDVRAIVDAGPTEESKDFFRCEYRLNHLIGSYKPAYVALIDGITMGGGVGLSVHGKYRVATERTLFAMPETAIGIFPDVGGSYFLPRLNGKLGLFLGLTGYRLKGEDVQKAGIATHYVPSEKIPELEDALIKSSADGVQAIERVLNEFNSVDNSKPFSLAEHLPLINKCFNANRVSEILHNLRKEDNDFANQTLKLLAKMSPTGLKVTKRQLDLGAELDLKDCLRMEYRLMVHHLEESDFKEGVRALLIDKDQTPKWYPRTIEEVTYSHVDSFFEPLAGGEELSFDDASAKL